MQLELTSDRVTKILQMVGLPVCRLGAWPLPTLAHVAEAQARAVVRDVLRHANVQNGDIFEAESVVAELAVNAVQHGTPPCELRILYSDAETPAWCEVVDSSPHLDDVLHAIGQATSVTRDRYDAVADELSEQGRGLHLVRGLTEGQCAAYLTIILRNAQPGKAVGFALPGADGWSVSVSAPRVHEGGPDGPDRD